MANKDVESYIVTKLNNMSDSLFLVMPIIMSDKSTPTDIKRAKAEIKRLIIDAEALLNKFNSRTICFNQFCNALMLLKPYDIPEVEDFLLRHSYEEMIYENFISTLYRIDNEEDLNSFDYKLIELLIHSGTIHDDDMISVSERIIKEIITGNKYITMEAYKKMISKYAQVLGKNYEKGTKCKVVPSRQLPTGAKSYSIHEIIYLNREEIEAMYESGNFEMLKAIYHEVEHIRQNSNIYKLGKNDPITIRERKEDILIAEIPGYYDENYSRCTSELEAEVTALRKILEFFSRIKIELVGKEKIESQAEELEDELYSARRILNGKAYDIDDLFNELVISRPDIFDEYNKACMRKE